MSGKIVARLVLVACVCNASQAYAQHEPTLHFMTILPQASYTNPAFQSQYKFSLGLPGSSVYGQYVNNGFTYGDAGGNREDLHAIDLAKLSAAVRDRNHITTAVQADLLRLGVRVNARMHLNWNLTAKTYTQVMVPGRLVDFLSKTSAALESNKPVGLLPFSVSPYAESLAYLESGLGASYSVNRKLTVGARIKLLKGIASATTTSSKFSFQIDDNYATIVVDLDGKTSGIQQLEEGDFEIEEDWRDYRKNTGFAVDLGGTYQVTDKLMLAVSLIDIGSIMWKNNLYSYRPDPTQNEITFKLMSDEDDINKEENGFEAVLDSISNTDFSLEARPISTYRTAIPGKIYISGRYALRRKLGAGVVLFAEKYNGRLSTGASASLYKEFGRRISTSLSYTVTNNSYNNIGMGITLNLLGFQFYVVGDNVLRAPIVLMADDNFDSFINNSKYLNVRAGLNFVFGWIKTPDKLPHPPKRKSETQVYRK